MGIVYVVHCIDTEGPLNESLEATFQRVKNLTGVEVFPSADNLAKLQNKELCLNGFEDLAAKVFSRRLINYNRDWHDIDAMLDNITSESFRNKYHDSFSNYTDGGGMDI